MPLLKHKEFIPEIVYRNRYKRNRDLAYVFVDSVNMVENIYAQHIYADGAAVDKQKFQHFFDIIIPALFKSPVLVNKITVHNRDALRYGLRKHGVEL